MSIHLSCQTQSLGRTYEIEIKRGLLSQLTPYLKPLSLKIALITDDRVAKLYGESLHQTLICAGLEAHLIHFPQGEQYKTRQTKEELENQLFEKGFGRDTLIIALGGGVVTDLAGYLAATYCRGVSLINVPTSFLGMVDASLGGKTGVNVPYGKNLLGCIYAPLKVFIDPLTLNTLPKKELINGLVESIKHSLIADEELFYYLETQRERILSLEPQTIDHMIRESCRIKKEHVEQDEREMGLRRLLNFGHTIGHALEQLTHYALSHGEAVAIGMLVESHLALQLNLLKLSSFERIKHILIAYHLPLKLATIISIQQLLQALRLDKKSLKGQARFVLLKAIGTCAPYEGNYCSPVDSHLIEKAWEWFNTTVF